MMKSNNKVFIKNVKIKKNSKDYIIETDDNEYCINEDIIIKYSILKGKEIDKDEFNKILFEIKLSLLFNKTLNYLSYGLRSEKEIYLYLKKNNKDQEINESNLYEIINKLKKLSYINDENYSKQMIDYYKQTKGKNYIIQFLQEKGIDKDIINSCIDNYSYDEEYQIAYKILTKYSNQIRKNPLKKQQMLCNAKLIRDGITYDIISKVVSEFSFIDESNESLEKDIVKLKNKYQDKQKIITSLLNKGYDYSIINKYLK